MKLATVLIDETATPVLVDVDKKQYWSIPELLGRDHLTMQTIIEQFAQLRSRLQTPATAGHPLEDAQWLAPIPRPMRNVWCVGRNYHDHGKELADTIFKDNATDMAQWPIVFTKAPESVVGPGADVVLPGDISTHIDYEAELAVIIGRQGKNIAAADAAQYIFGYTIVNDITARDIQHRHQQWVMGKSFDTFCPMGPWIVTADALDASDTRVRGWVNDDLRQDARTTDLIFDIPTLVETISRGITLYPGDIIATGTPAGVGMAMDPPQYLKDGDRLRVEIDGIGILENTASMPRTG